MGNKLLAGQTVNSEYVSRRLREYVRRLRPELWRQRNWQLRHDNWKAAILTQFRWSRRCWTLTEHNLQDAFKTAEALGTELLRGWHWPVGPKSVLTSWQHQSRKLWMALCKSMIRTDTKSKNIERGQHPKVSWNNTKQLSCRIILICSCLRFNIIEIGSVSVFSWGEGPNRVGVSLPLHEDGNASSFRNAVFQFLECRTMHKVQKPSNSVD
jgi:hypothetical protein